MNVSQKKRPKTVQLKKTGKQGRPSLFNYSKRAPTLAELNVVALLRKYGRKYTQEECRTVGIQVVAGQPKVVKSISRPSLTKLAVAHGIELQTGRPAEGTGAYKYANAG